jgi:hypothetical protein
MQNREETSRPDSLWRQLLSDWLSEADRAEEVRAQSSDERQEVREDVAA